MDNLSHLLMKFKEMRDVDEEDRETILSLKEKGLVKIGINVKKERLMARATTDSECP